MQAKQMSASLSEFALLIRAAGCESAAAGLEGLASVFAQAETKTVAAVLKKIKQHWKASKRPAEYPAALKVRLTHIAATLEASKAPAPAKDYRSLLTLCVGSDCGASDTFVENMREALLAAPPVAKKSKRAVPIDPMALRAFADELTALISDNAGFDAAVGKLAAARKFSNAELSAIAEHFLGYRRKYKSKAEVIKAIRARQQQDAIQDSKDRRIKEIAV